MNSSSQRLVVGFLSCLVLLATQARAQPVDREALGARLAPLSVDDVRSRVPDGVEWVPDIAYRQGHPLWKLDLAFPKAQSKSPRPAVVIIHGGGWRGGDKRAHIWARYPLDYAAAGFVAISVNYRLVPEHSFPACIEDVKNAVRWLRAHAEAYNVDPDRIGAYGNSAGAHLALMLALSASQVTLEGDGPYRDQPSHVQAVVASASPTDFVGWNSGSVAELLGGEHPDFEERARIASPLRHASGAAPPILLIHGTGDRTVPYDQPRRLMQALVAAGASDIAFKSYAGAGHDAYTQHIGETLPMTLSFMQRILKP